MRKALAVILVLLLMAVSLVVYIWFSPENEWSKASRMASAARSRVKVGMTREEVETTLSDAWHHDVCRYEKWSDHLFFYGNSNTIGKSTMVLTQMVKKDDEEIVVTVGTAEEYQWFLYADCSELLSNEKGK